MTHLTLHSCIASECSTRCQLKLKKPVTVSSKVSIFTSGTAGRGCSHSFFYILNICINISPYYVKFEDYCLFGFIEELYGGIFLPSLVI